MAPGAAVLAAIGLAAIGLAAAGCARSPSTLRPGGPGAAGIADLAWLMFGISAGVLAIVVGFLLVAVLRRSRAPHEPARLHGRGEWLRLSLVILGGIVIPIGVLIVMQVLG